MYMYIDMQIPVFQQLYILIVGISNFFDWLILSSGLCQCFDYPKTSLSVENENFLQDCIFLSFLYEIKVLNLKACSCTYLNVLNILVILYICCTFFQTNQQLFYYGRYYFIHTE